MKNISFIILLSIFSLPSLGQNDFKKIKITNDIELIKLSDNVFVHVSETESPEFGKVSSNGLIFIDNGHAFLFDTPMNDSITKDLVDFMQDWMKIKIDGFVPNHFHSDCMGGLAFLQKTGIKTYAHQMTIDIAQSKKMAVPTTGFKDSLELIVGDYEVVCYYVGAAHTKDNIVVWIPSEQILFAGCMVKEMATKHMGNIADADIKQWPKTLDKLMAKFPEAKIVVPGHGEPGGIELITHTQKLLSK